MEKKVRFSKDSIREVLAHLAWAQLEIMGDDVEDIQVLAAGDDHTVEELRLGERGGTLYVEQPQYGISMNITTGRWMQVIIRLPKDWEGNIDAHTISGTMSVRGVAGPEIAMETVSGDLRAMNVAGDSTALRTVSGDVKAGGFTGRKLSLRTVSGDLDIQGSAFESVKANGVSGDIVLEFTAPFRRVEGTTVSGDMTIHVPVEALDAAVRGVSGRVRTSGVSLVDSGDFVRLNSVSGDLVIISTLNENE